MKRFVFLSTLICIFSSSPAFSDATPLQAGVTEFSIAQTIDDDIISREVFVQAPSQLDPNKKYPIIVFLHGHGGNAEIFIPQLMQAVNDYQFVGVYPQGYQNSWDLRSSGESDE